MTGDYDAEAGRHTVKLQDGTQLRLKPANLLQMLQVRLTGLSGEHARHNAEEGTIFDYDDESNMYGVEMAGGEAVPVAAENVLLPDRSYATVHGLQGAPQYNGQIGQVLEYIEGSGRYLVNVGGGKHLKLKRANLRA